MSKQKTVILLSSIGLLTTIFIVLGIIFSKTEEEKINGLAAIFDVSNQGKLAYVSYDAGNPEIYVLQNDVEQLAVSLPSPNEILDIAFSSDDSQLYYTVTERIEDSDILSSSLYMLDTRSFDTKEIFEIDGLTLDITFDPKDNQKLFYLRANTFENYSPIARAYPHGFDVYSFHLETKEHVQHTHLDKYEMASLQVSHVDEKVYVRMNDDMSAETAEESFETKQKIFEIPLENPQTMNTVSNPARDIDIFDFTLIPNEEKLIFQSISNAATGENYQYDLYYYDWDKNEEKRLTDLTSYASRPVFSPSEKLVYFIVDDNFTKGKKSYNKLYKMDLTGENIQEIELGK